MVLVDTSCWTHALRRKGDPAIRHRMHALLEAGEAAWCDLVRLELWNGAANDWDKQLLRALEKHVAVLPIDAEVWQAAIELAEKARTSGLNVPAADLIIFACGRTHGVRIEHADKHYDLLAKL